MRERGNPNKLAVMLERFLMGSRVLKARDPTQEMKLALALLAVVGAYRAPAPRVRPARLSMMSDEGGRVGGADFGAPRPLEPDRSRARATELAAWEAELAASGAAPRVAPEQLTARGSTPRQPAGSRVVVSKTDAGTLVIDVPARGFGADTLFSAAFAVAWFSGVGAWTAAAVTTGPLAALFSLPFWLAGARARARARESGRVSHPHAAHRARAGPDRCEGGAAAERSG